MELDFTVKKLGPCEIDSPLDPGTSFDAPDSGIFYHANPKDQEEYFKKFGKIPIFEKAGPKGKIFHDPAWTKAGILTAGGLCPGLNNVIKSLTLTLKMHYHVPVVYGIPYGYRGLDPKFAYSPINLTPEIVDAIHNEGGTVLGSSRGGGDAKKIVESLVRMNINVLFCIGGDGTLRCAHEIAEEAMNRKLSISVVGIPKTIDNDICFMDRTFGFESAVFATVPIISAAHNEAKGAPNGVGLVHVMGRDSGFIAAYATLANTHVNYCLIPEEKFNLEEGENALFPALLKRLKRRQHAVVVVSEGAGQEFFSEQKREKDASGNVLHQNIGLYLKEKISEFSKKTGFEINVKYFDPTYQIRSIPAQGADAVFCSLLAQNAVHVAMAGATDVVIGHWSNNFTQVPISAATSKRKKISTDGSLWRSVRLSTWAKYE